MAEFGQNTQKLWIFKTCTNTNYSIPLRIGGGGGLGLFVFHKYFLVFQVKTNIKWLYKKRENCWTVRFIRDWNFGRNLSFQRMVVWSSFEYFNLVLNDSHKSKWVDNDSFLSPLLARIQFESCQFLNFLSSSKNSKSSRKHLVDLVINWKFLVFKKSLRYFLVEYKTGIIRSYKRTIRIRPMTCTGTGNRYTGL